MNVLEILLSRRWILKSRERELYYQVKEELARGDVKRFLLEKLGYPLIVNPYLIKVEKLPARPENWMGIREFSDPIEYVFLCMTLMFLEDKEAEEQFVLSALTEYIEGQYREDQIDWTVYRYRRCLIKVLKYCAAQGILDVDDGSEESFAKDAKSEVLYENTGVSRYFMKNFTRDIMGYESPADFEREEWIDVDEERGIVRRQRVYRELLMSMGVERSDQTEEDFAYIKNFRNMIQGELSERLECELQVHRGSAFLILGENCRMGRTFPEENTKSDAVLLLNGLIREKVEKGEISLPRDEKLRLPRESFRALVEECKEKYGEGFNKTYREMTMEEFYREMSGYMEELELISRQGDGIRLHAAMGKIVGEYPEDFRTEGGKNER